MRYQHGGTRVAASQPTSREDVATSQRTAVVSRDALRDAGRDFDAMLREEISQMAHECDRIPEPVMTFQDLAPTRHRAASMATVGMAIAALALSDSLPDRRLERFVVRLSAWVRSLRPAGSDSLATAWVRETQLQAAADIAQAHAVHAIERRDPLALERAIADTAAHIDSQQALLAQLKQAHRTLKSATPEMPRRVVRILSGVGQPS